jgi:hypothetical protein
MFKNSDIFRGRTLNIVKHFIVLLFGKVVSLKRKRYFFLLDLLKYENSVEFFSSLCTYNKHYTFKTEGPNSNKLIKITYSDLFNAKTTATLLYNQRLIWKELLCFSVCLFHCLYFSLSLCLSDSLSLWLSVSLSFSICLSFCISLFVSIFLSLSPSLFLSRPYYSIFPSQKKPKTKT